MDPKVWVTKYERSKANRYLSNLLEQVAQPHTIGRGAVHFIVKSGEVWTSTGFKYESNGMVTGLKERARLICPGDESFCGAYVYTMQIINEAAKSFEPGYRVGENLTSLLTVLREQYNQYRTPRVVCMDGSAWDSTQHREMLEIVDHAMLGEAQNLIHAFWEDQTAHYYKGADAKRIANSVLRTYQDKTTRCLVTIPGIDALLPSTPSTRWMKERVKRLTNVCADTIMLVMQDGVISGKCAMTTFGNTFRNITAQRYLLWRKRIDRADIHAAGDDCVILTEETEAYKIRSSILKYSHRDPLSTSAVGFGNVYTDVSVSTVEGYDFCSKTLHLSPDGEPQCLTREIGKALFTKQCYNTTT